MAIPEFDSAGILPAAVAFAVSEDDQPIYSGHECTMEEVEERFVTAYPDSLTRAALLHQVRLLVGAAQEHLDCFLVVISGAFVIDQESPTNVFVVLDVPGETIDKLDGTAQWKIDAFFNGRERQYGTDEDLTVYTGIIRAYPPDHAKFELGNAERALQRHMASCPVPETESGGYLEIFECEGGFNDIDDAIFKSPAS